MTEPAKYTIGSRVACRDGVCGRLARVVIDPVARALTHLVVEPGHWRGLGRLVPVGLVDSAAAEIRLRCTLSEFTALDEAEETEFVPGAPGDWDYGEGEVLAQPYFVGAPGLGGGPAPFDLNVPGGPRKITHDRVPLGEVEVRRGEHVHATDGAIGRVRGLVVDPADQHVTHVLLDEGHLWGHKQVAIPIGAVKDVRDGVRLTLSKSEIRDLPSVDVDLPG